MEKLLYDLPLGIYIAEQDSPPIFVWQRTICTETKIKETFESIEAVRYFLTIDSFGGNRGFYVANRIFTLV